LEFSSGEKTLFLLCIIISVSEEQIHHIHAKLCFAMLFGLHFALSLNLISYAFYRFDIDDRSVVSHIFHHWGKKQAFQNPKRLLEKVLNSSQYVNTEHSGIWIPPG